MRREKRMTEERWRRKVEDWRSGGQEDREKKKGKGEDEGVKKRGGLRRAGKVRKKGEG